MENHYLLKRQNTILQSSIESYVDVLMFSIDRDYQFTIFNNAFRKATYEVYGIKIWEGMNMLETITNLEDQKKAKNNCDRALAGESHVTIEVYGEIKRVYFETRYNPIYADHSEIIGVTILSTNITERKIAEENLQKLNKELEAFSYSVSHDLRAPLRSINAFANILKSDFSEDLAPEAQKLVDKICQNTIKLGRLIDDLLEFSRMGRNEIVKNLVDMEGLVKTTIAELINDEKNSHVDISIGYISPIYADAALLKQVWINVISNALKYSSKKEQPLISITCTDNNKEIVYEVTDNGVGFDMQFYNQLFGVFQRLHSDKDFEGTGVGLAIVQKIIQKHGGRVWAEGKVDEGCKFFFSLPKDL